jgi:hypothetical protein
MDSNMEAHGDAEVFDGGSDAAGIGRDRMLEQG